MFSNCVSKKQKYSSGKKTLTAGSKFSKWGL